MYKIKQYNTSRKAVRWVSVSPVEIAQGNLNNKSVLEGTGISMLWISKSVQCRRAYLPQP